MINLRFLDPDHTVIYETLADGFRSFLVGHSLHQDAIDAGRTIADYVAPAATWDSVRGERNQLLKDTDWQAGTDVTMTDAQKAYRKKLRDLPATNSDPTKIVFPDAP
tara:strand:- start:294 stop:614 length:321 start_codon:yes stop_codon:yes gene_type:complete